jgi:transcriptional regulator with GAF, ATPase, and Fis domain
MDIQDQSQTRIPASSSRSFQALRAEAERQIVLAALHRNEWHVTRTAQELGLADHASLLKIMRRLNLRREEKAAPD